MAFPGRTALGGGGPATSLQAHSSLARRSVRFFLAVQLRSRFWLSLACAGAVGAVAPSACAPRKGK